jgi:hypothetical protein
MNKYAIIVMSEGTDAHPEGQGRMLHAMYSAKDLKASGAEVKVLFDGIGVKWLSLFDSRPDKYTQNYGQLFDEIKDTIGGACNFCASVRFGAGDAAKKLNVPLLGEGEDHQSIARLALNGYQIITF